MKVGDRVLIKTFKKRPQHWAQDGGMDELMGRDAIISTIIKSKIDKIHVRIANDDNYWYWKPDDFTLINLFDDASARFDEGMKIVNAASRDMMKHINKY